MKIKHIVSLTALLIVVGLFISSCKKKDDAKPSNTTSITDYPTFKGSDGFTYRYRNYYGDCECWVYTTSGGWDEWQPMHPQGSLGCSQYQPKPCK